MSTRIREFSASTDADRVAEFMNDQGYGPIVTGLPLNGQALLETIHECDIRLLLVAESRGAIIGTLGYARMSGRRVAQDGHLYAVMFAVERSIRGGFLVSELFAESFRRFPALGLRTLRLEVDPANRRAFPLYVRVGFRNVGHPRPDEDGYLELVNHLPGIVTALALGEAGSASPSMPGSETRSLRSARELSLTGGVHLGADNGTRIDYEVRLGAREVKATVDARTGHLLSATIDGTPTRLHSAHDTAPSRTAQPPLRLQLCGFEAELDVETGTLAVHHRDRLGPVLIDAFPVCGSTPAGVRRPATTAVITSATTIDHGTRWTSTSDHLTRIITVSHRHIDIQVTQNCGEAVTASPWSGFRDAVLRIRATGRAERSGNVVRGVWPPEATDFEPAVGADFTYAALGTHASWREPSSGVGIDVLGRSPGTWRVEGPHLARISGEGTIAYRIDLIEEAKKPPLSSSTPAQATTRPARRSVVRRNASASRSGLEVSAGTGVRSWRYRGLQVLSTSDGRGRAVGPLTHVTSALWVAALNDRTEPDQGVEWAQHDTTFVLDGAETDARRWTVRPSRDFASIEVAVSAGPTVPPRSDLAIHLFIPSSAQHIDLDPSTAAEAAPNQRLHMGDSPWRTWAHSFHFPTPAGDVLVSPASGNHTEALLRSGPTGVLATLLARPDDDDNEPAGWRLSLA